MQLWKVACFMLIQVFNWSSILTDTANILKISQPSGQPRLFIVSADKFLRSTSLSSDFASSLTTVTSDTLSDGDVNAIAYGPTRGNLYGFYLWYF